jgi:hypothetical protein
MMSSMRLSSASYAAVALIALLALGTAFPFPARYLASAHTFSNDESSRFLSLVDKIRAETGLVVMNLENNNATLAQSHAAKALGLLDDFTIRELRERNSRISTTLVDGLKNLDKNVSSLASGSPQGQIPQNQIQSINQAVMSLNDTLGEAISSRIEMDQQNNATVWALSLAELTNTVLSNYGNATGSPFDLRNMSAMSGMQGMQTNQTSNMTMAMSNDQMHMPNKSSNNTMPMTANATSSVSNMTSTTSIVDEAAYQSAQYLANNSMLKLFDDMLKPLTLSANNTMGNNATNTTSQEANISNITSNVTSSLNDLEANVMELRDAINNKAAPNEVMTIAHTGIHPLLMKIYNLTLAQDES